MSIQPYLELEGLLLYVESILNNFYFKTTIMKEKVIRFVTNRWFGFVAGLVIAMLYMWQEQSLGSVNAWIKGIITPMLFGAFAEVVRYVTTEDTHKWKNLLWWLAGAVIGVVAMLVV